MRRLPMTSLLVRTLFRAGVGDLLQVVAVGADVGPAWVVALLADDQRCQPISGADRADGYHAFDYRKAVNSFSRKLLDAQVHCSGHSAMPLPKVPPIPVG